MNKLFNDLHDDFLWWLTCNLFAAVFFLLCWFGGWFGGDILYCNPYVTKEYCHRFDNEAVDETFMFDWRKD